MNYCLFVCEPHVTCLWTTVYSTMNHSLPVYGLLFTCLWTIVYLSMNYSLPVYELLFTRLWTIVYLSMNHSLPVYEPLFTCLRTTVYLSMNHSLLIILSSVLYSVSLLTLYNRPTECHCWHCTTVLLFCRATHGQEVIVLSFSLWIQPTKLY